MYQRVSGPIDGYYVASYACRIGELGTEFLGYYKLCRERPEDYLHVDGVFDGFCEQIALSGVGALMMAEAVAKIRIASVVGKSSRIRLAAAA